MIALIKQVLDAKTRANYFFALDRLQENIFNVYIKRDYVKNRTAYDKKFHALRYDLMRAMRKVRLVLAKSEIEKLVCIYEIILSLSQLKLRINDHATFEVADVEFKALTHCLKKIFHDFAHVRPSDLQQFNSVIANLEAVNQNALQVVTYDPIVYLFFLQDLRGLQSCLSEWIAMVRHD